MKSYKYIPLTLGLALMILITSCSSENTTTVTLYLDASHTGFNQDIKQLPLIDRFLTFFSGTAYAYSPPSWTSTTTKLILTITAIDMETITINIPFIYSSGAKVSYTVKVPSGQKRKFIITTVNGSAQKNWGGQKVIDLTPGDDILLSIMMIPMPILVSGWPMGNNLYWNTMSSSYGTVVQGFKIYYSSTINGEYSNIGTVSGYTTDMYNFSPSTGYYRASVYGLSGESPLSDAISYP